MKRLSKLSIVMILLIIATMLTACGGPKEDTRTAGEIIKEATLKSLDMESAHGVSTINFSIGLPEELKNQPGAAQVLPFLENSKLTIESTTLSKEGKGHTSAKLSTGSDNAGMNFGFDMYILSPKKIAFSTPLYPKNIVLDVDEMNNLLAAEGQEIPEELLNLKPGSEETKKFFKDIIDLYAVALKGIEPTERTNEKVKIGEKEEELTVFTYSYKSNDEVLALVETIAKNILTDETLYDKINTGFFKTIFDMQMKAMEASGEDAKGLPSKEEFDKVRKEALDNFDEGMKLAKNQMSENATINEITLKIGVDKDTNMVYTKIVVDASAKVEGKETTIKFDIDSYIDQINAVKAEDIKTVELTEENSASYMELIMSMMGGMINPDMGGMLETDDDAEADE